MGERRKKSHRLAFKVPRMENEPNSSSRFFFFRGAVTRVAVSLYRHKGKRGKTAPLKLCGLVVEQTSNALESLYIAQREIGLGERTEIDRYIDG